MTVLSNDGQSWLTKLERIGEKSAYDRQMVFNNLGHLLNVDMLKEQFHWLNGNKAVGIDRETKETYGVKLDENLKHLLQRIRRGTYRPKPARVTEIPKEDGSKRPLVISCFEDKLVQLAASQIPGKIYEPLFLPCSYGFRPGLSCHDALRTLLQSSSRNRDGAVYVIDEWFAEVSRSHIKGRAEMVRYADDMVFLFGDASEAERFYKVLPKRLEKFGLELHREKSQIIPAGWIAAQRANQSGKRLSTFNFLGFTCYWGKMRKGGWRLKFTSRKDRFASKLKGLREFLWKRLSSDRVQTLKRAIRGIKGWINYHGITDNQGRVRQFILQGKRTIHRWLNRQGGKGYLSWGKLVKILKVLAYPESWKTVSMFRSHRTCVGTRVYREPDAVIPQVRF
ncbi:reverse transcriptase domain-containing protein [Endozoicomonas sp. SCSIO W0465]|uniref:reverse transcriptase domain-containing protein n=1 Tax=Endozoicomonas sp. SCSIO W0465 TaxID=2918516 RepID=UPI002074CF6D|nr:reverse transcriptase domain-containing protein [Endozoicomonas sp. SCSIO W0465]USE37175.1 hypothetical protein MJO57_02790 [Endozoicomonas sp. SCSIO W0465]